MNSALKDATERHLPCWICYRVTCHPTLAYLI